MSGFTGQSQGVSDLPICDNCGKATHVIINGKFCTPCYGELTEVRVSELRAELEACPATPRGYSDAAKLREQIANLKQAASR